MYIFLGNIYKQKIKILLLLKKLVIFIKLYESQLKKYFENN